MLAQDEAGAADHAAQQDAEAEPEGGVEGEDERESYQCSDETAGGCSMGADLDAVVDDGTDYLDGKCPDYDAEGKLGNVQFDEEIEQGRIARDAHDVGNESPLAAAHLVACPAIDLPVKQNAEVWQEDGEDIDDTRQDNLREGRQHVQVTEREEDYEAGHRKIER